MVKQKETEKEKRRAALAAFKSRRRDGYGGASALDTYDASAADDVQDVQDSYDEVEYRRRVEANRAKEDFVVDDGKFY
jgi:hypothetical protein